MGISFELSEINRMAKADPRRFMAECDSALNAKIALAAAGIATAAADKPIVLLSGPSGSGKTTMAGKLSMGMSYIGVKCHVVSMDDYYLNFNPGTHPRDKRGNIDFESPECLDIPLLTEHFGILASGGKIEVPHFDFTLQKRLDIPGRLIRLQKDDVVIFEGIHALNPSMLRGGFGATRVYASARSGVKRAGEAFFKSTWCRLVRRMIRDDNFRGWKPDRTMSLWAGVRRGEKKYISPYKEFADIVIDTSLPYEAPVLKNHAAHLFSEIPAGVERGDEFRQIVERLAEFCPIEERMVSVKSLLREFIGGGLI